MTTTTETEKATPIHTPYYASHRAPLYFLVFSILIQLIGIGVLSLILDQLTHPVVLLVLHSVTCFLLARWLKLSFPWQMFNLLLAPGVVLYQQFALPSGYALGALVVAMLMYAPTFWTRVPYFPTHPKLYDRIAELLPEDKELQFIDLGCGMGRLLAFLSKARPQVKFTGVEISPLAFLLARLYMKILGRTNVEIQLKNFWNMSLEPYDFVYAFLAPGPMPALWEKVQEEMKNGSVFVTNTFKVEGSASQVIAVDESHQNALYVHRR